MGLAARLMNASRAKAVPFPSGFCIVHIDGNNLGYGALSDGPTQFRQRGQAPRDADNMIEQIYMGQRRKADPSLDEARLRQQAIGVKLRQMFDQVVNEPVPDEFLDILRRADEKRSDSDR